MQPAPLTPLVVQLAEEPTSGTGVVDVLLGVVELTAVFMGVALLLGVLLGAILVGLHKLRDRRPASTHASEDLANALNGQSAVGDQ